MMTGRSRTGSLKHLVLFPMFLVVLQRKLQKRWTKSWLPVSSGAPMQRSIVKANHPSPTMHGSRTKATGVFWGFISTERWAFVFFFGGGGAEDNKKRKTWDTHNFVMGSLQRKIGNCEFQWFETRRVINQRSAPNVWIKCCLLAFSFKRGIFFEGNGVSPNPWPLERFRNLDEQFHFGAFISIVGEGSYPLSETDTCPIKRKRKIFLTQMCLFAYLLSVPLGG